MVAIDFYQAIGIEQVRLASHLDELEKRGESGMMVRVVLQNEHGDVLTDSRAQVRWESGTDFLLIGSSGILRFYLDRQRLSQLTILSPTDYRYLKQRSLPFADNYVPEQIPNTDALGYEPVLDGTLRWELLTKLKEFHKTGEVLDYTSLRQQLRRKQESLTMQEPPEPATTPLTPAEIYDRCKAATVIFGSLNDRGELIQASGVIIDATGVVATNYHVLDKSPAIIARAVMTGAGDVYAVTEVLAANRPDDVALVRVAASGLPYAPLAVGDPPGTSVTIISHPDGQFFSLTHGYISRYFLATAAGAETIRVAVTADFADGSSGAPIFNPNGAVTGLVSATNSLGYQMVVRYGAPVDALRKLLTDSYESTTTQTTSSTR